MSGKKESVFVKPMPEHEIHDTVSFCGVADFTMNDVENAIVGINRIKSQQLCQIQREREQALKKICENRVPSVFDRSLIFHVRSIRKKSKYGKGITIRPSGNFQAQIHVNGKLLYLGTFSKLDEAQCAYDDASEQLYGDRPNGTKSLKG